MEFITRKMNIEELEETLNLVKIVFDEFEEPYYSELGVENFYKFANYDNVLRMLDENLNMLIAEFNNKIVGMIAYRDYSHISMLFVNKEYHHNGIASKLVNQMIENCKNNNQNLDAVTVNSSPYAVKFYEKLGFIKQTEEQEVDGIKFVPMRRKI